MESRQDDTNKRVDGINDRLDALNGKTTRHGDTIGDHHARLRALEKSDEIDAIRNKAEDDQKPITRREVYVFVSAGGGMLFFLKVLPWLIRIAGLNP